jgi:hypothetical protein
MSFCPLKALARICHSVFPRNLMFYPEHGSSKLFRYVCIIRPCIQEGSNFTFSAAQWRYRPKGSWPPIFGFQQLIYQHLVGALGSGIGPSLGVCLHRTTVYLECAFQQPNRMFEWQKTGGQATGITFKLALLYYLYFFQQMHLPQHNTNIVSIIKTFKNSYMFRSQPIIIRESPGPC